MATLIDQQSDSDDICTNDSANPSFDSVLSARLSRRSLLKGSFGLAASVYFGSGLAACSSSSDFPQSPALKLTFDAIAKSLADVVSVPSGYSAAVLYRLGDPTVAGVADYKNDGSESGASFAQRAGDHHDGMHYFGLGTDGKYNAAASDRGLLVINHEAITPSFLHPAGVTIVAGVRTVNDEVIKELNAHGVSIIEVNKTGATISHKKGFVSRNCG